MSSIFPHEPELRMTFEKIMAYVLSSHFQSYKYLCTSFRLDRNEHFKNPVSKAEVPDYFDIIKRPMCWNIIDSKLDRHEYWDLQAMKVRNFMTPLTKSLVLTNVCVDRTMLSSSSAMLSCTTRLARHFTKLPNDSKSPRRRTFQN